jgi:hypothetical protein
VRPYHVFLHYLILKGGLDISFVPGSGGTVGGGRAWHLVRMADDDLRKLVNAAAAECDGEPTVVAAMLLGLVSYNRVYKYLRAAEEDRAQRLEPWRHDGLVRAHGRRWCDALAVVHVSSEQLRYLADLAADKGGDISKGVGVPQTVPAASVFKDRYTGASAWTVGEPAESVDHAAGEGGYPVTGKLEDAITFEATSLAADRHVPNTLRVPAADIFRSLRAVNNRLTPAERAKRSAAAAARAKTAVDDAHAHLKCAPNDAALEQALDEAYRAYYIAVACAERDWMEVEDGRVLLPSHLWPMFIDSTSRGAYPLNGGFGAQTFRCRHNGEDTIFLKRIHQAAEDLGWGVGKDVGNGRREYARGGEWVHDFFPFFLDLLGGQPEDGTLARSIRNALLNYCSIKPA